MDLVAAVSQALADELGDRTPPPAVLPCGVALDRFRPIPREAARLALGIDRATPCLLFPADPPRARASATTVRWRSPDGVRLITLGATAPDHVTLAINAANAVLVPSDAEGFGLAVLEALACDVPVLATPVGVHAEALAGSRARCARPTTASAGRRRARRCSPTPTRASPAARARAAEYSSDVMAGRVVEAWQRLLER